MLCGRQDTLKVHFILCQQRIFFPVHNPLPQVAALWTPHKPGAIPACVCKGTKLCFAELLWLPWNTAHKKSKLFVFIYSLNSKIQSKLLQ